MLPVLPVTNVANGQLITGNIGIGNIRRNGRDASEGLQTYMVHDKILPLSKKAKNEKF
jgi:hypothetical protein